MSVYIFTCTGCELCHEAHFCMLFLTLCFCVYVRQSAYAFLLLCFLLPSGCGLHLTATAGDILRINIHIAPMSPLVVSSSSACRVKKIPSIYTQSMTVCIDKVAMAGIYQERLARVHLKLLLQKQKEREKSFPVCAIEAF